ncbi:MAG: cobalamin B12-binding domain-containing protein [Planctomycetota bacterium]
MNEEMIIEQLFPLLTTGDRTGARALIQEALESGMAPEDLAHDVFWPVLETIDKLFRSDQLTMLAHHYATRLIRNLVDMVQLSFTRKPSRDRSVLVFSGQNEHDELSGMLVADLLEADGYEVRYGGSGIANDEILGELGQRRSDVLLMFASGPHDAPNIRELVDTVRDVNACPDVQIVVGGGIFNRAEGLAEEIGADLWAKSPRELIEKMVTQKDRRATEEQRTVGRTKRSTKAA